MRSTSNDTSSSAQEADPSSRQGLIELGNALVAQLNLERSSDLLGRWMAHHLARLLKEVEAKEGTERGSLEQDCFDAILAVWKHRNCLPNGLRPLEPAERILDVLAALDPAESKPFYSPITFDWDDFDTAEKPLDIEALRLETVRQFDQAARKVIGHLLAAAVEDLPDDTRKWVHLARRAGAEGPDLIAIRRIIVAGAGDDPVARPRESKVRALKQRLEEFDVFLETATDVRSDLVRRLAEAEEECGGVAE
jgi:hypothetical protein